MKDQQLIPHLFRTEFRKIVAVLARFFGSHQIDVAEDIASDTFMQALEIWPYKGTPSNPQAWLYTVAKRKALNIINRQKIFDEKVASRISSSTTTTERIIIDLSEKNISDSQLQMLFAVCHPAVPVESQIALALRLLCGFGIEEIAHAFLSNKETINKRLFRAKETLKRERIAIEFPAISEVPLRREAVVRTLYLLFSEGYCSETDDAVLREDLCLEAMRLTHLLVHSEQGNTPAVNALLALMCFHSSRFRARKSESGEIILYENQDEQLWNQELISRGVFYLHQASSGNRVSKYHLEAAIAWWHTAKTGATEKWDNILQLYNQLLKIEYSPVAALNRTYALSKVKGNPVAIAEAEKLQLINNPYYHTLLGELYKEIDSTVAKDQFQKAMMLARAKPNRDILRKKIEALQ